MGNDYGRQPLGRKTESPELDCNLPDAIDYYRLRAARELEKADSVGHRPTARMHRELAKLYERRAAEAEQRSREAH